MVEGFTTTMEVVKLFEPILDSISSKLLRKLVTLPSDGGTVVLLPSFVLNVCYMCVSVCYMYVSVYVGCACLWCMGGGGGCAGTFPDMKEQLLFFMNGFDRAKAKKDGVIVPNKGVSQRYLLWVWMCCVHSYSHSHL